MASALAGDAGLLRWWGSELETAQSSEDALSPAGFGDTRGPAGSAKSDKINRLPLDLLRSDDTQPMMASNPLDLAPAPRDAFDAGASTPHAASSPGLAVALAHAPVALAPGAASPYITPAMTPGPCGNSYVIPPRPKPGRKPATDDPPSKRKQQNREAQRAFRQRKTQKMEETNRELQRALDERRQHADAHQREVTQLSGALADEKARCDGLQRQLDRLTADNDGLRHRLDFAQDKLVKLELELDYHRRLPPHNQLTPPAWRDPADDAPAPASESRGEISASAGPTAAPQPPQSSGITLPPLVRSDLSVPKDGCGRCADNGDCPCVDSLVDFTGTRSHNIAQPKEVEMLDLPTPNDDEMEIDFTNFGKRPARPSAMEPPCKPGTCDACMKDPLQKRFCETLARERPINRAFLGPEMAAFASAKADEEGQTSVKRQRLSNGQASIDCAEAYRRFFRNGNFPVDQEHPTWMRELITLPPSRNDAIRLQQLQEAKEKHKRHLSAYELDMASVLNVLKSADTRHSTDGSSELHSRHNSIAIANTGHGENCSNDTNLELRTSMSLSMPMSNAAAPSTAARNDLVLRQPPSTTRPQRPALSRRTSLRQDHPICRPNSASSTPTIEAAHLHRKNSLAFVINENGSSSSSSSSSSSVPATPTALAPAIEA